MKRLLFILTFSGIVLAENAGKPLSKTEDFESAIKSKAFADKSLLIRDLINQGDLITVITRPSGFGKSVNLDMARRFFTLENDSAENEKNRKLFEGLKIAREVDLANKHQGQYPSIFLSLKTVKGSTFEELHQRLSAVVSDLFNHHSYLRGRLEKIANGAGYNAKAAESDLSMFNQLTNNRNGPASETDLKGSLKFLSQLLSDHHNNKHVWVFVDDYDTPLLSAIDNKIPRGVALVSEFLSAAMKGNPVLERALIMGMAQLSKVDLFSKWNNVFTDNILTNCFSYFGFTDEELGNFFRNEEEREDFITQYGGYRFYSRSDPVGLRGFSSPRFVMQYLQSKRFRSMSCTEKPERLARLIKRHDAQGLLYKLRGGGAIGATVLSSMILSVADENLSTEFFILLYSGYLTLSEAPEFLSSSNEYRLSLRIPNSEILACFKE